MTRRLTQHLVFICMWLHPTKSLTFSPFHYSAKKSLPTTALKKTMKAIEVETKFRIDSTNSDKDDSSGDVKDRLRSLGFVPCQSVRFVDHYYDEETTLSLSLRDTWLRFRATSADSGQWQLKRGKNVKASNSTAAVYEELEGEDAISEVMKILKEQITIEKRSESVVENPETSKLPNYFKYPPKIPSTDPKSKSLKAFCSLETSRETYEWSGTGNSNDRNDDQGISSRDLKGIKVDLDQTNLGYAVGEVEKVVHEESEVHQANEQISAIIDQILEGKPRQDPPCGKLESYLKIHRPDHYRKLLEKGVLQQRKE